MRSIQVTPVFEKQLRHVPELVRDSFDDKLAKLAHNPVDRALGFRKLRDVDPPVYRLRVGSYRLLYQFDATTVTLLAIGDRKEIYR